MGEISGIKDEIKRIAARNSDLEKSNEDLKLDLIKQKYDLTEKFDKAKDDLVSLAKDLELSLENQKKQTENAEALAAERLGRVGEIERELSKHEDISTELKIEIENLENDSKSSIDQLKSEVSNAEKKLKSRDRQVNELKRELQMHLDKEKEKEAKKEEPPEPVQITKPDEKPVNGQVEEAPIDVNYLKHVVLRYIMAPISDREHLLKALGQLLQFTPEESKLISEVLQYKKSWFGSKPTPRGSIAPSIQK